MSTRSAPAQTGTMARRLVTLALAALVATSAPTASAAVTAVPEDATAGIPLPALWPLPRAVTRGPSSATLVLPTSRTDFTLSVSQSSPSLTGAATSWAQQGEASAIVTAAFQRLQDALYTSDAAAGARSTATSTSGTNGGTTLTGVDVSLTSTDTTLGPDTNETYSLRVPGATGTQERASVVAASPFGAMHALQTLGQLVRADRSAPAGSPMLSLPGVPVAIEDAPRFPHRGIMLDTSRHYLHPDTILRTIDGLAQNKLNVLHIHLVDAQSFPVEIDAYPALAAKGAYNDGQLTYTQANLSAIHAYGAARGVRVIAEIDVPGHAYAWGLGYKNVTADCPTYPYVSNINNIPLDPTSEFTWEVLGAVLKQVGASMPDAYLHIGGDEVIESCWRDDPSIAAWMAQKGWSDYDKLMQYFITRAEALVASQGQTPVHWIEVFDGGFTMAKDAVVQVWKAKTDLEAVVKAGYRGILSDSDVWYLNCGFNPSCAYSSFDSVYENEPLDGMSVTPAQAALVIGGEAALWSEFADDTNVDPQLWPRLSGVAERLWSPRGVNNATAALPRLTDHRCRMVHRGVGIAASPAGPGFCDASAY